MDEQFNTKIYISAYGTYMHYVISKYIKDDISISPNSAMFMSA